MTRLEHLLEQSNKPTKTVSCRLPVAFIEELDLQLAFLGVRRSDFIEAAIRDAQAQLPKKGGE